MRIVLAVIAALVMASALVVQAQPKRQPRDCGMFFEIKAGKVISVTEGTAIECEFEGQFIALVMNHDAMDYTLTLDQFRYNGTTPATAGACVKTNPLVNHPVPNGGTAGKRFRYKVKAGEIGAFPGRKIKNKNHLTECYKFSVLLEDDNGVEAPIIDPDLEITEPPPPPPVIKPF